MRSRSGRSLYAWRFQGWPPRLQAALYSLSLPAEILFCQKASFACYCPKTEDERLPKPARTPPPPWRLRYFWFFQQSKACSAAEHAFSCPKSSQQRGTFSDQPGDTMNVRGVLTTPRNGLLTVRDMLHVQACPVPFLSPGQPFLAIFP